MKSKQMQIKDIISQLHYLSNESLIKNRNTLAYKLDVLVSEVISNAECMARHRRIQDTDESLMATINTLRNTVQFQQERIDKLKLDIANAMSNNRARNLELDALHYVWCDGGCSGGTHRFTDESITEEIVLAAERNTARLKAWYLNNKAKKSRQDA